MSAETCVDCGEPLFIGAILSGDDRCSICWGKARTATAPTTVSAPTASAIVTPSTTTPRAMPLLTANDASEAEIQSYLRRMRAYDGGQATPPTPPQPSTATTTPRAMPTATANGEEAEIASFVARMVALDDRFLADRAAARATTEATS